MIGTTVTLGELTDRALNELEAPEERGHQVVLTGDVDSSATTFLTSDLSVLSNTTLIEFEDELVLVTDATVPTVMRGYYGTTPASHANGTVGYLSPRFPRYRVAQGVISGVKRLEALGLPFFRTSTHTITSRRVEIPEDVRDVISVQYEDAQDIIHDAGFTFYPDLPLTESSTGKAIQLKRLWAADDVIWVTSRIPYRWSTHPSAPDASATIELPEGMEELPALYAAAWMVSGREISRTELDRSTEMSENLPSAGGAGAAIVRNKWQEFYRSLDELRRLEPARNPITRPYKARPKSWRFR